MRSGQRHRRGRGHTGPEAPEIKKALSLFFFPPNSLLFARGRQKAHHRPVIDPRLLV